MTLKTIFAKAEKIINIYSVSKIIWNILSFSDRCHLLKTPTDTLDRLDILVHMLVLRIFSQNHPPNKDTHVKYQPTILLHTCQSAQQ